jgi:hypothetical protein
MGKFKKTLLVLGIVAALLTCSAYLLLRLAFGPIRHTYIIEISPSLSLICKEEYNADLADVFYDVSFQLIQNDKQRPFGQATFRNENWREGLVLHEIGAWYVLPMNEMSYSKILFAHKTSDVKLDTLLSAKNLIRDKSWRSKAKNRTTRFLLDESRYDSIAGGKIFITFNYKVGDSEPFIDLVQQISYRLDQATGKLITENIFDAAAKE